MKNPKLIAALALAALAVLVFLQNRQTVVLNVLSLARVETTLATALCGAFLVGLVTGIAAHVLWKSRAARAGAGSNTGAV